MLADMHNAAQLKSSCINFISKNSTQVMKPDIWDLLQQNRPTLLRELYQDLADQKEVVESVKKEVTERVPCIMCDKMIECRKLNDNSGQLPEMVAHLETVHKQKMCPVCSTLFDTRLPIFSTYFSNHVMNHFSSLKYPSLSN